MELVGDPWLLDLATRGPQYRCVSALLIRCQILTARFTGHVLDLGAEDVRRRIASSARHGVIPRYPVSCLRCGWSASLTAWEAAVDLRGTERSVRIEALLAGEHPEDARFLQACDAGTLPDDMLALYGDKRVGG